MFLSADGKSAANVSSANISCVCVFTSQMCSYMSSVCVTAVCIAAAGGDQGLLCVFCVLQLVDVEYWWKMTDASWHVCETLVTVIYMCVCVIQTSDRVFTLTLNVC